MSNEAVHKLEDELPNEPSLSQQDGQQQKPDRNDPRVQQFLEHFPQTRFKFLSLRVLSVDFEEILKAEQELINDFGFVKEEVIFLMKHKPSIILFNHPNLLDGEGNIKEIQELFVKKMGYTDELFRTLVVKYPFICGKTTEHIENYYKIMKDNGIEQEAATKCLLECPKLISIKLEHKIKEICFLFYLYHKIPRQDVFKVFENFPYLFCCDIEKVQKYMGKFKQLRMTQEQVIKICSQSYGLLATKYGTFQGLFDYLKKKWGLKAQEVGEIINQYPEFAFLNKGHLLLRKMTYIQKVTKKNETYLRNMIRRHPELLIKSWASYEAKINYIQKNLNRSLMDEKTFPLLLLYNYNGVIRPRCELLKDKVKHFEFQDVLPLTNEQFCLAYDIPIEELEQKIAEKPVRDEKDRLWNYVPAL